MIKAITGTWFEFQHHNIPEGKYWNPICRRFTADQWRAKVDEMADIGMKYIVLLSTAMVYEEYAESYVKGGAYPFAEGFGCDDPLDAVLSQCDKRGLKVFISVGFYGVWTQTMNNMVDPEVTKRAFDVMAMLCERYGKYESFYGWYYPDETCIYPYFHPDFMTYVNRYSAFARTLKPGMRTLIAPYGTNILKADDTYVSQLASLDIDIVAYQDEIGVRKSTTDQTPAYYEALRKAHDKAGRSAFWADMEMFEFEGDVYRSALVPASIERVKRQLEAISPYVDEVLIYQYMGIMNQPGTTAYCGHPDSVKLYEDYDRLRREISETR